MWLYSRRIDLAVFGGSALVSLLALAIGQRLGLLGSADTPEWAWIVGVLLVDVAHVWATVFRVYLDPVARKRSHLPWLVPVVAYAAGVVLYAQGELVFWRALAYVAVFHFVRQQWGWVALYRARAGESGRAGKLIDAAAVVAATVYPLVYWHTHLPRQFQWFVPGDFTTLPAVIDRVARPLALAAFVAYAGRVLWRGLRQRRWNPGKDLVVSTTALCWYAGIVVFDSDYAFTVTNVFIHGVPYLALVYAVTRRRAGAGLARAGRAALPLFLTSVWALAYFEELVWDRGIWHERGWLFGGGAEEGFGLPGLLVPLLALPQLTHYVLDGFVWRRAYDPALGRAIAPGGPGLWQPGSRGAPGY